MANLLTVEKLDNAQFSFVLNGDIATEIINTRNDMLSFGDRTDWKTSEGANLIKEQNVTWQNVTLVYGATTIIPTSIRNLFDELTALGFFDWVTGGGSGGVDRFTDLLDTFDFTNQANKMVVVNASETQLIAIPIVNAVNSTDLLDMPATRVAGKILKVNAGATAYELVDPPAGANGYNENFVYTSPDPQEFTLATSASINLVFYNGFPLKKGTDWTQVLTLLTILPTVTMVTNDEITAIGVI